MESVHVSIIYYSATGTVHALARAAGEVSLRAARHQGRRVVEIAAALKAGRGA
ncbi:hypothetical protein ABZ922_25910 [Streptomyces shenzhenensis]|uniref:hypothetical protein n=1 Tax=Streptomyces shenzhenensis TaxID=943815 RepID=UPI0033F9A5B5